MSDTFQPLTDLPGARVSARVPVSQALLNRMIAERLAGSGTPVRALDIQPRDGDRFDVAITVTWPFVPVLQAVLAIDAQPGFPASPVLVLRWSLLGAAGALAGRVVGALEHLPAGIRLDGDRLLVDLGALAAGSPAAAMLPFVKTLELHTLEGRVVIDAELAIPDAGSATDGRP